ncbi:MAG: hypothetical protein Q8P95_03175, partial [bacterium]|nr:hypothetical protein [bacterium]
IKSMGHSATTPERSTQALMEYDLLCLVALAFPLITKPRLLAVLQQLMSQLPNVPHPVPRDIESDRFTGTYPVTLENFDAAWKKLQQTVDEAKPPVPPASRGGEDVPSA